VLYRHITVSVFMAKCVWCLNTLPMWRVFDFYQAISLIIKTKLVSTVRNIQANSRLVMWFLEVSAETASRG